MRTTTRRTATAALALAALLLGCGDDTPLGGEATIDFADVNGAWASIEVLPSSAQYTVTSDSLYFFDAQPAVAGVAAPLRGMRRVTFRDATMAAGTVEVQNAHFAFELVEDEVHITYDCPLDATDCAPPPHQRATIADGLLTLHQPMQSSASSPRFRRTSTSRQASW